MTNHVAAIGEIFLAFWAWNPVAIFDVLLNTMDLFHVEIEVGSLPKGFLANLAGLVMNFFHVPM